MKKVFLLAFVGVSAAELVSGFIGNSFLHHLSKPLIMTMLGAYYWASLEREQRSMLVVLAIFFSFLGDTFLMYEKINPLYFMLGLGAFLLSHILYILAYREHKRDEPENPLQGIQKIRFAFPIVLAGTGLVVVLYPALGGLQVPVMLYTLVIVVMTLNALLRFGFTNTKSFFMVFAGAILFMISDSVLAVNKFLSPIDHAGVWIMITYCAAQYFIVTGLIKHRD